MLIRSFLKYLQRLPSYDTTVDERAAAQVN